MESIVGDELGERRDVGGQFSEQLSQCRGVHFQRGHACSLPRDTEKLNLHCP
jgi:hypothetical protein